jgi:hypothetical protein
VCLDLLRSRGQVIIDGDLASDRLFASLLAALLPGQTVVVSSEPQGVAMGAALLWDWSVRSEPARRLTSPWCSSLGWQAWQATSAVGGGRPPQPPALERPRATRRPRFRLRRVDHLQSYSFARNGQVA